MAAGVGWLQDRWHVLLLSLETGGGPRSLQDAARLVRIGRGRPGLAAGVLAFWAPDLALLTVRGGDRSGWDWLGLSAGLPLIVWLAVERFARPRGPSIQAFAVLMLLGIWVAGPAVTIIGVGVASDGLGAFRHPLIWLGIVAGTVLFPLFTWELATYEGTLFALIIVTAALTTLALSSLRVGRCVMAGTWLALIAILVIPIAVR